MVDTDRLVFECGKPTLTTEIETDHHILNQIALNLVRNALQYSTEPVKVRLSETDDYLLVEVIDHGVGILPHEKDRIFDLLERGSNISTAKGLGIGLYMATQFAQLINAEITVESNGKNQGSCFTVHVPKERSAEQNLLDQPNQTVLA